VRLASRLPAGSQLIFRHYGVPERTALAQRLARICRARRIELLVAGDLALADRLKAGLHLPDAAAANPSPRLRLWRRRGGKLTAAAHDRLGLVRADRLGAEAVLLSPVFPTLSHPETKPLGLLAFRRLVRGSKVPVVALGGIDGTTVLKMKSAPIAGVAAVGAFSSPRLPP